MTSFFTWTARAMGIILVLFFGAFASDTGANGSGPGASVIDIFMNLLPALICGVVLIIAWWNERLGGIIYIALALAYMVFSRDRLDWAALIGGPLLITGGLFLLSWRLHARASA